MTKAISMTKMVADVVRERGRDRITTVTDLQGVFPHVRRCDLMKALHNAAHTGYIFLAKKGRGHHDGQWLPGDVATKPPRVSSVFQLGNPLPESDWPKGWIGQVHRPLGEWNSTEEIA